MEEEEEDRGRGQPTLNIMLYIGISIMSYSAAIFAFLILNYLNGTIASLTQIIDLCKIVSIGSVIAAGGEILENIRKMEHGVPGYVVRINSIILKISMFIFALLVIKLFVFSNLLISEVDKQNLSTVGKTTYRIMSSTMVYFAMFPIFAYSILNGFVAYFGPTSTPVAEENIVWAERLREKSLHFFIYSNMTVSVPLIGLIVLVNTEFSLDVPKDHRDLFLGGAVAVVLLVSGISAKAVEEYNK